MDVGAHLQGRQGRTNDGRYLFRLIGNRQWACIASFAHVCAMVAPSHGHSFGERGPLDGHALLTEQRSIESVARTYKYSHTCCVYGKSLSARSACPHQKPISPFTPETGSR